MCKVGVIKSMSYKSNKHSSLTIDNIQMIKSVMRNGWFYTIYQRTPFFAILRTTDRRDIDVILGFYK